MSPKEASESIAASQGPALDKVMVKDALWRTFVSVSTFGSSTFPALREFSGLLDLPWLGSEDNIEDAHAIARNLIDQNWCSSDGLQDLTTFLLFRSRAGPQFDVCGYPLESFFASQGNNPVPLPHPAKETSQSKQSMETALRRASHTLKYRRLIVTEQGQLGVAVSEARRGDSIAVLRGCSVPIVLRPVSVLSSNRSHCQANSAFMVVGAAYIHGIMSGETVQGRAKEQNVALC